ncbi:MAG: CoA-binding protein [Dehalococcoidia bacterium]|nr:CoA-binding protein [Dehalococcoidia bacterium]MDP7470109.1 CoA-binding protein [Dehalococcoidia bacterium]
MSSSREIRLLFEPQSVAVIGASRSPSKLGHMILSSLVEMGYMGKLYPVNPYVNEVLGLVAYPVVTQVTGEVDLESGGIPVYPTQRRAA